jgi:hypothetical protein
MIWLTAMAWAVPPVDSVELRPAATVSAGAVLLADIAVIEPPAAAGELATVEIGPAPLPGGSREFAAGYVRLRLRKAGVDLKGVAFRGAERVSVSRQAPPPVASVAAAEPSEPARQTADAAPTPATADELLPPPAAPVQVRRGTICRLVLSTGGLSVEALGELMMPCAVGQIGKFRVAETRALVAALLTSASTAEVIR